MNGYGVHHTARTSTTAPQDDESKSMEGNQRENNGDAQTR